MIAVSTTDGILRIQAEVEIPSAEAGQWSPERHARLIELIRDYVEAAELVDFETSPKGIRYATTQRAVKS